MTPPRRGQATVEYLMLVCVTMVLISLVGYALKRYGDVLIDKVGEKLLDTAIGIALG
jgi:hypothetical protein